MEMFYVFGFIALTAAIFKIIILYQVVTSSQLTSALNILVLALICQNSFEFLSYLSWANDPTFSAYMVGGVFVSLFAVAAAAISLIMKVSESAHGKLISMTYAAFGLVLVALHSQGLIVSGYEQVGYTIIAVEGTWYSLFSIYVLTAVFIALGTLIKGSLASNRQVKDRCRVTLIAITPLCIVAFGVVALRQLGFNSSTALAMPLASTLLVWVLMVDERGDFLRLKIKWAILLKLAASSKDIDLNNWSNQVEKMLILEALRGTGNNKSEAAKLVALNKTTFHRKAEKYLAEANPGYAPARISS
ncbi:MAG: hypothetical protein COA96_11595 [SAR86 cluster bacterium]|uniref:DNA binding HTH domain-containing protein n=1 Tax=SAR86 cluster bacterium TaxID=2030880 RepID=A0A2A5AW88_9GAMM|nr:MAG: hypothetical protein COA96_11595 [SAR86 cluster bacterium]